MRRRHRVVKISIHAPREGGDPVRLQAASCPPHFNPRPPRGGRLKGPVGGVLRVHFNPRPPRGGRPSVGIFGHVGLAISIHAPREGGDPHPCPARRPPAEFQSTPPARGATILGFPIRHQCSYFNPRPPRGGRRWHTAAPARRTPYFNPRPPRGGRLYRKSSTFR